MSAAYPSLTPEERRVVEARIALCMANSELRKAHDACPTIDDPGVRQRVAVIGDRAMVLRWERDAVDPRKLIDEVAAITETYS